MIPGKLLYEFIEQGPVRLERVRSFLRDVAPHLSHRVVQIDDPFGPTITDKDIGLIVVSAETIKGAQKINEIRKEKGFPVLDVHHIILFNDALKESEYEEDKISSSSQRIRILGDRLAPSVSDFTCSSVLCLCLIVCFLFSEETTNSSIHNWSNGRYL